MQDKPPKPKPGDILDINEEGTVLFVHRENGRRIDVDLKANPDYAENFGPAGDFDLVEGNPEPELEELAETKEVAEWLPQVEDLVGELKGSTPGREDIDQLKVNTVIALAGARANGTSQTAVWKRPDTCNVNTYYQRWRKDPHFMSVLDRVFEIIAGHQLREEVSSLARARRIITDAAPEAAQKHVDLMKNPNPFVALQASGRILSMVEKGEESQASINITIKPAQLAILAKEANSELEQWEQQLLSPG